MLEKYFSAPKTLRRLRGGITGPHIDGFADDLEREGYAKPSAVRYIRAAVHLGMRLSIYMAARSYTGKVCLLTALTAPRPDHTTPVTRIFDKLRRLATHNKMDLTIHSADLQLSTSASRLSLNYQNP
jgi:hypothetical protein